MKALDNLDVKIDCVSVAVAHDEFKKMTLDDLTGMMKDAPILIDVRSRFDGKEAISKGFYYKTL